MQSQRHPHAGQRWWWIAGQFDVWIIILLLCVPYWLVVHCCRILADVVTSDVDACTMFVCTKLA